MEDPPTQAVGLLGGSFDPVHNGHLAIARSFLNADLLSELWILLTPDPPHKTEQSQAPYELRLTMLEQVFNGWENLVVSDVENNLPSPSYTLQTIEYLSEHHPQKQFYICMGEDSAQNFTEWHKWQNILYYCDLLIARRPSTSLANLHSKVSCQAHYVDHNPVSISSTDVRKAVFEGRNISELVPDVVQDIIHKHNLY